MIIKEKRWLSRFVAMLCVLTMVVGVLTPASWGIAAVSIKKVKLQLDPSIEYFDCDETPMAVAEKNLYYDDCSTYKYRISEDEQYIEIVSKSGEESAFTKPSITFYVGSTEKPNFVTTNGTKVFPSISTSGLWKVVITMSGTTEEESIISLQKQYTVTFTNNSPSDCNIYDDDSLLSGSIKYDENANVNFDVVLNDSVKESKVPVVRYGRDVQKTPNVKEDGATYSYSISKLMANTDVIITTIDKICSIVPAEQNPNGYNKLSSATVKYGDPYRFYVTPGAGRTIKAVYAVDSTNDGFSVEAPRDVMPLPEISTNYYEIANVTTDMKIYVAVSDPAKYNVSFDKGTGYTISSIKVGEEDKSGTTIEVEHGKKVSFDVIATQGYEIARVKAGDKILTADGNTYTLNSVESDTVISVVVNKESYTIEYIEPDNKEYDLVKGETENVEFGTTYNFHITPKDGYKAPIVTAQLTSTPHTEVPIIVDGNRYTISKITGDTTITIAEASKETRKITFNDKQGYYTFKGIKIDNTNVDSVIDERLTSVAYGSTVKFKIDLDPSCNKSTSYTVTANGAKLNQTEGEYTIEKITENQTIEVTGVEKNKYTVTLQNGTGYTLDTSESTQVSAGGNFSFSWKVDDGYKASKLVIKETNGEEITGLSNNLSDSDRTGNRTIAIDKNITISLEVTPILYTVTTPDPDKSKAEVNPVNEADNSSIPYNGSYSFRVTPKPYYKLIDVMVDGVPLEAISGVYTISSITKNKDITITTEPVKLTVHYVDNKYNTEIQDDVFDITKTDKVGTDGKIIKDKLENIDDTKKLYKFEGWDKEEVSLATNNKDSEITLTAKWRLKNRIASNEYVNLTTTGESSSKGFNDGKTSYTYKLSFHSLFKLAEDLEEDLDNISITGYGTFYSDNDITVDEDCFNSITDRQKEQSPTLYKAAVGDTSEHINNYYANVTGLYASDLNDTNNFFYLNIGANKEITRHAVGWIELTIGGETIIIYSQDISVTTGN